jgi:phosphorylcholine metabolism protein LicD
MNKKNLAVHENKIRVRTKEELQIRKYEFLKICEILNKLDINYFLITGVLLGAIRENDFIPWDWDVELSVFSDEVPEKLDLLIDEIKTSGFTIEKYYKELSTLKIDFVGKLPKETTAYTINGWNHDKIKNIFWRRTYKIPDHFLLNMKKIHFFEKYHFAPYPPEKFLEYQYGNWKKPLKTSNKLVYMRKEFHGINIIKYLLKNLKKII